MQMVPNAYGLPNNRTTTHTSKSLIAAWPLLIACILAASVALQAPAGVATTAGPSLSARRRAVSYEAAEAVQAVAAEPPPVITPETPEINANPNHHLVVAGDTVGAIASRFGVNVYDMLAANGLGAYTLIHPGQTLKLSGPPVPVPAPAAPAPAAPAPAAPALTAPAARAVRTINLAGSGGQAMVDRCIGPIHFTPTDAYSLFITEHDFCGGWARFSGIGVGETVVISGYGTYTAAARGQVAQGATTNAVSAVFGGFPRAILQTCIPGTNQMLLIALN
jgi:LysM repeat protein